MTAGARPERPSTLSSAGSRKVNRRRVRKEAIALVAAVVAALVVVADAGAHAIVSPPVAKSDVLQQFTLSVPTEKANVETTKIELTVPAGFSIDSFEPAPPGWQQQMRSLGTGAQAVVQTVVWMGGHVPTGQDAVFRFNASAAGSRTYTFDVRQTYSDGSVVDWNGPQSSDAPAPQVEAVSSFGGGSSSTLAIVALVVGALGLLVGVLALAGGKRPLV
jgi:periplasmic copper chaperone A